MARQDDDGSTRISQSETPGGGTSSGRDVTGRMSGTQEPARDADLLDERNRRDEREVRVREEATTHIKTSAAATFGLIFGLSALICALTAILAPVAIVLAIIGLIVAIVGIKKAKLPGITGGGVAKTGLVMSILALLLGIAVVVGASVLINNDAFLNKISDKVDQLKQSAPSGDQLKSQVPGK